MFYHNFCVWKGGLDYTVYEGHSKSFWPWHIREQYFPQSVR